jgi:ribosomal protein S18 acetylase RimI-like enzyme
MNLQFRRADPDDVEEVIPLIYCSASPLGDYCYNVGRHTAIEYLRVAFVAGSGKLSYSRHVVAVLDGHVVGIGAFLDGEQHKSGRWNRIWLVLRVCGPLRCWTVLRRLTQLRRLWSLPGKDDLSIEHLGVREDMRGKGIATALLTNQIEMARSKGINRCVLDVAVTNPRAQALYERLGFRVVGERKPHIGGADGKVPEVRHMELVL